jgi:hypothetical protein
MSVRNYILSGLLALSLALPISADAGVGDLGNIIDYTVGTTPLITTVASTPFSCPGSAGVGACNIASVLIHVVRQVRVLAAGLAFIILVVAGFRLVISQAEEAMTTAKRTVLGAVVGLFLLFIVEPVVDAFFGGFTAPAAALLVSPASAQNAAFLLSTELMGILSWIETLVAIVAVGLIVAEAVGALASFGSEERMKKMYHAIGSTIFGILLLVFDRTIASVFGLAPDASVPVTPTTMPVFVEFFGLVRFVLLLIGIVAVGVLIYAGFLMILNLGNEEMLTRGKKIVGNTLIGLVMIILCYAIVSTVILGIG